MKRKIELVILSILCISVMTGCKCQHEWKEASCDVPKTCIECGETEGVASEHKWQEATYSEPKTCSTCGQKIGESLREIQEKELFEEYNLLSITAKKKVNNGDLVHTIYEIQNKSDSLDISNMKFEYIIVDENTRRLNNLFDDSFEELSTVLKPREKAELTLISMIGSEANEDTANVIISYSFDMDGKHYEIDMLNERGKSSGIENQSNVKFEEKHILIFDETGINYKEFENNSEMTIKTLKAEILLYNSQGQPSTDETVSVLELGKDCIEGHGTGKVKSMWSHNQNKIEVISYTYETVEVDENGYNHFEIDLVTKEAVGSTNNHLLEIISILENELQVSTDVIEELTPYINMLGKKVNETGFNVSKDEDIDSTYQEFFDVDDSVTLLNVSGKLRFTRDYNTLLITDIRFESDIQDTATKNHIYNALKEGYGMEYETFCYEDKLRSLTWNIGECEIIFNLESGGICIGYSEE